MKTKKVKMADLYPIMAESLKQGNEVKIIATGFSMKPMLRDSIDTITLEKQTGNLKKYDLPLYRRKDGTFVLHRVIKAENDKYIMCGDNQVMLEYGITNENIVGITKSFTRSGKEYCATNKAYKFYCVIWVKSIWVRKKYRGLKRRIKTLFKK